MALLLVAQFFLSTELLAIAAVVVVVCILLRLVAAALVTDPAGLRRRAPHAAQALGIGVGVGVAVFAWPIWFALAGPAHLSGLVWPNISKLGGFLPSSFVTTAYPFADHHLPRTGRVRGGRRTPWPAYLGWGFLAVLVAGVLAFWRDRRLWFFGFAFVLCLACSLLAHPASGSRPASSLGSPVIENVIQQRFMAFGYLAAAVMLAVILDRVHRALPHWRGDRGPRSPSPRVALVPMAAVFGERLPFAMRAVTLPRWYSEVAPRLPPGRVLLSFPAPFSGVQSALAWQAVNSMRYSQAGGGGPQGVADGRDRRRPASGS